MVIAFPCKFQGNGCRTFSELIHKTSHEALCSFRPVSCQYAIRGCTQILLYHLMEKHVLECRFKPPTLNKMQSQLSVSSRDSQNWRQRKIFLIVLEDDQFFYQFATETIFIDDTIKTTNLKKPTTRHTKLLYRCLSIVSLNQCICFGIIFHFFENILMYITLVELSSWLKFYIVSRTVCVSDTKHDNLEWQSLSLGVQ